jgi:serine/threonine-protein kinase
MPIDKARWADLRPLLAEALELPPDARTTWLDERRRRDPALVAELEALLASEQELDRQGFMVEGASELFAGQPSLAGQRVGAYTLESLLGQGGMGSVWLGRRTDGRFEGKVALKFLSVALLDPVGQARFRREGSALARLTHPNIARLIDAGVSEAGQPYLVLEYVDGKPLDEFCDDARLPAPDRIRLFGQVLAAVQHAHANLIVHRDLKPSNILVTADGTVKLLDFGIAKLLDGETAENTELTTTGGGAFTPEYAAPEQIRGEPVSVATDVYGLGVLLYQLLAGRHPTSEGCRTPSEFVRAILDTDPARLSAAVTGPGSDPAASARSASTERLRRLYLGDLDNILARALKKDPAERYVAVAALADDLVRFLRHEPVSARADSWGYRASKFVRRNRGSVASALVVSLALIGATIVTWRQMLEARRQRDEAVFQAKRADAIRSFQGLLISQIGDQPLTMRQLLDKGRGILERRYQGDPRFTATILGQFADRYGELSDIPTALALLTRAESLAIASGDQELIRDVGCSLANQLNEAGQEDSARLRVTRSLAGFARERHPDRRALASCLMVESQLVGRDGPVDTAMVEIQQALAQLDTAGAVITLQGATVLNQMAIFEEHRSAREAARLYARAAAVMDSIGYGETFPAIGILSNSYNAQISLGNIVAALAATREAARRVELANPGSTHPVVAFQHAAALLNAGQPDSAIHWYQRVVAAAGAQGMRDVARRGWIGIGRSAARVGDLPVAHRALDSVLAINRELKRPTQRDSLFLSASIHMARDESALALTAFQGVLRADGFYAGKRSEGMRPALLEASQAALLAGQADTALMLAEAGEKLAAVDSLAQSESAFVGEARLREAKALRELGRVAEARARLGEALAALVTGAGEENPRTDEARALQKELGSP